MYTSKGGKDSISTDADDFMPPYNCLKILYFLLPAFTHYFNSGYKKAQEKIHIFFCKRSMIFAKNLDFSNPALDKLAFCTCLL